MIDVRVKRKEMKAKEKKRETNQFYTVCPISIYSMITHPNSFQFHAYQKKKSYSYLYLYFDQS
jgi:tRNA U38,U39,U40 pseudouridine synthase TruA